MIHIYKFNLQVSSSLNSRPLVWHAFSVFIFPINKCDKNKHTTVKEGERELYKTNIKSSYACEFIVLIHQYRSIWKKSFNNLRHRYVMSQIPFFYHRLSWNPRQSVWIPPQYTCGGKGVHAIGHWVITHLFGSKNLAHNLTSKTLFF